MYSIIFHRIHENRQSVNTESNYDERQANENAIKQLEWFAEKLVRKPNSAILIAVCKDDVPVNKMLLTNYKLDLAKVHPTYAGYDISIFKTLLE